MKKFLYCLFVIFCLLIFFIDYPLYAQQTLSAMGNYNTGRNLETQNRMNEANVYYNEAIRMGTAEINGGAVNADAYVAITYSLRRQLRYREVITWGERGLLVYPNEHRLVQIMGEAYFYLNDHNTSLTFMQRYVNAVPQGGRASVAYFFMGEIYRFRSHFQHAEVAYSMAVRLYAGSALWWYRLASVREAEEIFPEAVSAYETAVRLDPNYQLALNGLSRSRLRL